uniref:Uncharacterized protein n=1 Tax=uncultured bacterium TB157_p TaxID=1552133 RepID=A0A0K0LBF7_9BACT|nr:hypothetical protein [uncultured bacterium TB157_p]
MKQAGAARTHHCCFAQERQGAGRRGSGNPLCGCQGTSLSLSPSVRTLGNVHCACTINYYLPGSAFDKLVSSPSFCPRSTEQQNPFAYNSY